MNGANAYANQVLDALEASGFEEDVNYYAAPYELVDVFIHRAITEGYAANKAVATLAFEIQRDFLELARKVTGKE